MATFFHVDRGQQMSVDLDCAPVKPSLGGAPPEFQQHLDELFPTGLTRHGAFYMAEPQFVVYRRPDGRLGADPAIELIYEYVRRSAFPDRPSRYQSLFGFERLEEAEAFRFGYAQPTDRIWAVEAESSFRADMENLKFLDVTPLVVSYYAHLYWSGAANPSLPPKWEHLLPVPVTVKEAVA